MDESHPCIGIQEGLHAPANLIITLGCEALHHDRHRPRHIITDVRTADTLACLATEETRIVLAPYETASVLINRIIHLNITQIAHTQKRWNIGIIHQKVIAETIYLICINLSIFRMIIDCIFLQGILDLGCQGRTILCNPECLILLLSL